MQHTDNIFLMFILFDWLTISWLQHPQTQLGNSCNFTPFSKTDRERMKTLKLPVPWHHIKMLLFPTRKNFCDKKTQLNNC